MLRRALQIIGIAVIIGVLVFMVLVLFDRGAELPEQNTDTDTQQNIDNEPENTSLRPNPRKQQFQLATANISCSNSSVQGVNSRVCSGNISAVPLGQSDIQPGVYKINEQTKLLHDNKEQDLNSLQQLAQNNTVVQLKLAQASVDTLSEIIY